MYLQNERNKFRQFFFVILKNCLKPLNFLPNSGFIEVKKYECLFHVIIDLKKKIVVQIYYGIFKFFSKTFLF